MRVSLGFTGAEHKKGNHRRAKKEKRVKENVFQNSSASRGLLRTGESWGACACFDGVAVLVTFSGAPINTREPLWKQTQSREQPDPICLHLL